MINPICGSPFIKPLNLLVAQKEYAVSSICDTNVRATEFMRRSSFEEAYRTYPVPQARRRTSMASFTTPAGGGQTLS